MENTNVKVSVIMPVYNARPYLEPAVDSIMCQTLKDIELICVDDGSTDSSLEFIKEYQKRDPRIRIVTETNAGPATARNNGMRRARGEYLAFLDADDFYEPKLLESLYSLATEKNLDIAIAGYDVYNDHRAKFIKAEESLHGEIFDEGRVASKNENPNEIFFSTNGAAWNKLFKTEFVVGKALSFPTDIRMYEDVYFVLTSLSLAQRVSLCDKVLVHHRVHNEQARAKLFRKYYAQIPLLYVRIREFLVQHGMFAPLLASYLNYTAYRSYKVFALLGSDAKADFWNMLHSKYAELMGWHGRRLSDFEDPEVCEFVTSVEMLDFEQYKRRVKLGITFRLEAMRSTAELSKGRRKVRNLLAKTFAVKLKK